MLWGIVVGLLQAATPLAFWWLDSATVYALGLAVIAAIYIGFAVADGRPKVIAVESSVTFAFVVVAAAAITGSPWLLVAGMIAILLAPRVEPGGCPPRSPSTGPPRFPLVEASGCGMPPPAGRSVRA